MARRGLRDLGRSLRRRSVRFRLTALYCGLFLPSAVVLVAITYVLLVYFVLKPKLVATQTRTISLGSGRSTIVSRTPLIVVGHGPTPDDRELLVASCIVLIVMIAAGILLGWILAGRVLRPLRVITASTRQISARDLHQRLALAGPNDELKELGDTIDGLLARLEAAFDSQRRFVANASHELRTPLMLSQTLLQVALADPDITLKSLRAACQEAIDAGHDQAELIDALLTLARSQRGLDDREPVDLAVVVDDTLARQRSFAASRGVQIEAALDHALVDGDTLLVGRLVSNLLDNAIRYNVAGGHVEVTLAASRAAATLTVGNTGPAVAPGEVRRLLEPFQRAAPDRMASPTGLGLGLSIVVEIAEAHGATLDVRPRLEGGLIVTVTFPRRHEPEGSNQTRAA